MVTWTVRNRLCAATVAAVLLVAACAAGVAGPTRAAAAVASAGDATPRWEGGAARVEAPAGPAIAFTPAVSMTKTADLALDADGDGRADLGDVVTYTIVIREDGAGPLAGAVLSDTLDANTAFVPGSVRIAPVAWPDAYTATGNVPFSAAAPGLLANDRDPDGGAVTAVAATGVPSAHGGRLDLAADGSFTYRPPAGFVGVDTVRYTIVDDDGETNSGRLEVTISDLIWFVRAGAAGANVGTLEDPFNSLPAFAAINDGAPGHGQDGQTIFLYSATNYGGGVTLRNGQKLIGQAATGASLADLAGIVPAPGSFALPPTGGGWTWIQSGSGNGITLARDNLVQGMWVMSFSGSCVSSSGTSSVGALTMRQVTINNTQGVGLYLGGGGTVDVQLGGVYVNSGGSGVVLAGIDGTLSLGSGTLHTAQPAFRVTGGRAAITYNGAIETPFGATALSVVDVAGGSLTVGGRVWARSGGAAAIVIDGVGSAFTLSIASVDVVDMQAGVRLSDLGPGSSVTISAGSISLSGAGRRVIDFAGPTAGAYDLSGVALSGPGTDGLSLGTTQQGLYRFGALQVNAPNGGVGVRVSDTAAAVTFSAINQTGGVTAVALSNTTGSFTVAGGTGYAAGGVLTGLTGPAVTLASARGVTLNQMGIYNNLAEAVTGSSVTDLALNGCSLLNNGDATGEGTLEFAQLGGTVAISGTTIEDGYDNNVVVTNQGSTALNMSITDSTVRTSVADSTATSTCPGGGQCDGLQMTLSGSTSTTLSVLRSTFANHGSDHMDLRAYQNASLNVTIANNTMTGQLSSSQAVLGCGVLLLASGNAGLHSPFEGRLDYNIHDNTISGTVQGAAIGVNLSPLYYEPGQTVPVQGGGDAYGRIVNNTVGSPAAPNSGSAQGSCIALDSRGGPGSTHTVLVTGNRLYQYNNHGIQLTVGETNSASALNAVIQSNVIANPGTFGANGVHLNSGTTVSSADQVCFELSGNSLTGAGANGGTDFRLRQRQVTTVRLPGYAGGPADLAAVVAFVQGLNPIAPTGSAAVSGTGGGFAGGAACPRP